MFSARFFVPGEPYPMGSGFVHQGRYVRAGDSKIRTWQRAIKVVASVHAPEAPIKARFRLRAEFVLERRWMRRDVDKMLRSSCDALTGLIYTDDSLIWDVGGKKRPALDEPVGAHITVEELPC